MAKSKIIILGRRGFLGSCLYENFSKDGEHEVVGLSSADLDLTSEEAIPKLVGISGQNAVMIMAASALNKEKSYGAFWKEIAMFNNLANPELLGHVKHFILVSSTAIYGHHSDVPIVESSPVKPDDIYSTAKLIGEIMFNRACQDSKVNLTIVRPGILYGQGDNRSPLFRFINDVYAGRPIEMHGDDSTRLVWLHKEDAWRAIRSIINEGKTGDYNIIADGNGTSLKNLAEVAFNVCGKRTGIKMVQNAKISPNLRFDLSKFSADFPGFEFTRLEDGAMEYRLKAV
ncbi:MAG: NAD(P)-dependent oxidoreductase [Patescibacteria group bacterium]|mgnify:CR=1 FL=1